MACLHICQGRVAEIRAMVGPDMSPGDAVDEPIASTAAAEPTLGGISDQPRVVACERLEEAAGHEWADGSEQSVAVLVPYWPSGPSIPAEAVNGPRFELEELTMAGGSGGAAKPETTRREPEDSLALKGRMEAYKRRYDMEGGRLLGLVEGQAGVGPGGLRVGVRELAQRKVPKAFLVSKLGAEGYEEIRAEAPHTLYCHLRVRERPREWGSTRGQGAEDREWTVFGKEEKS